MSEPAEAAELTTIPTPPNQFTAAPFSGESLANPFIAVIFSEEEWVMVVRTLLDAHQDAAIAGAYAEAVAFANSFSGT